MYSSRSHALLSPLSSFSFATLQSPFLSARTLSVVSLEGSVKSASRPAGAACTPLVSTSQASPSLPPATLGGLRRVDVHRVVLRRRAGDALRAIRAARRHLDLVLHLDASTVRCAIEPLRRVLRTRRDPLVSSCARRAHPERRRRLRRRTHAQRSMLLSWRTSDRHRTLSFVWARNSSVTARGRAWGAGQPLRRERDQGREQGRRGRDSTAQHSTAPRDETRRDDAPFQHRATFSALTKSVATLMQSAAFMTWWAHPAGTRTACPGRWWILKERTPCEARRAARSGRVRKKRCVWMGL